MDTFLNHHLINIMKIMIKKKQLFFNTSGTKVFNILYSTRCLASSSFYNLIHLVKLLSPFPLHLLYFIFLSIFGFLALKASKPRSVARPRDIDLYFTSVSAVTLSSMSAVEMEVFSSFQLTVLTTLILLGGEVFVSIIRLLVSKYAYVIVTANQNTDDKTTQVELGLIITNVSHDNKIQRGDEYIARTNSLRCLCYTILSYFVVVHVLGSSSIALYINSSPSAKLILENKGIQVGTFSFLAAASSFANCGFIPTNENILVFKKHTGLLLILIPQVLVGGTLFPVCLMFVILVLDKVTKRPEFGNILNKYKELGYKGHLMSKRRSCFLGMTVMGFLVVQFIVFVAMEWNSEVMDGLSLYEKVVASLFQVANTRHAGENVFDLSLLSPAVMVMFVVMMYISAYTSFVPVEDEEEVSNILKYKEGGQIKKWKKYMEYLLLSQASYLVIFIILICITERQSLKEDPLNFNVFNILLEVISAYGNVGYTMGYSCNRRLTHEGLCEDKHYGFVGRWSDKGKLILIVVMFFGRLKNFHAGGGAAWKLS